MKEEKNEKLKVKVLVLCDVFHQTEWVNNAQDISFEFLNEDEFEFMLSTESLRELFEFNEFNFIFVDFLVTIDNYKYLSKLCNKHNSVLILNNYEWKACKKIKNVSKDILVISNYILNEQVFRINNIKYTFCNKSKLNTGFIGESYDIIDITDSNIWKEDEIYRLKSRLNSQDSTFIENVGIIKEANGCEKDELSFI